MPIAHIYPSQYSTDNLNVSNPSNMLTPVDSTTYATLTAGSNSGYSSYLFLYDFNIEIIPANAVVNSFSIKLKYESNNLSIPSGYNHIARFEVYDGTQDLFWGDPVNLLALNTYNIPLTGCDGDDNPITLTFDILKDCLIIKEIDGGDAFIGLQMIIVIPPSKKYSYENKIYGAEIEVDYSVPSNSKIFNMVLPKGR